MIKKFFIWCSALVLFFIGLSRVLQIGEGRLEHAASYVTYPFLVTQKRLRSWLPAWLDQRSGNGELAQQRDHYRDLYENSQQELLELKSLLNYTNLTQDMREFLQRYKAQRVHFAQILLKNFEKNHFFLVDAGSTQGVTKNMIAVYKGCLLGRVLEVYPLYSKVILISDPGCKVAACCVSNNVKGIHEGTLHQTSKLSYVNHLEELKEGDLIISSGEGAIFPRGFGLGKIKHWERDDYTCLVDVEPLIDTKKIEYCTLLAQSSQLLDSPEPGNQADTPTG